MHNYKFYKFRESLLHLCYISAYAPYGAPGVAIDNVVDGKLVYGSTGYLDPNVELDYPESIEKGTWYCT